MEDWLPLLLGVIWVVFTLYNKGKKKRSLASSPQQGNKPQETGPSIIEQILSGKLGEQEEIYSEPIEEYIESAPVSSEFAFSEVADKKIEAEPFLSEELSQFTHEGQHVNFKKEGFIDNNQYIVAKEIAKNEFDLKKAVVYSAILNAPYIDYK